MKNRIFFTYLNVSFLDKKWRYETVYHLGCYLDRCYLQFSFVAAAAVSEMSLSSSSAEKNEASKAHDMMTSILPKRHHQKSRKNLPSKIEKKSKSTQHAKVILYLTPLNTLSSCSLKVH